MVLIALCGSVQSISSSFRICSIQTVDYIPPEGLGCCHEIAQGFQPARVDKWWSVIVH